MNRRIHHPVHPVLYIWFAIAWAVCVFMVQDLAMQLCLMAAVLVYLRRSTSSWSAAWVSVRVSVPFLVLYAAFGALFSSSGPSAAILWHGAAVPMLGTPRVSESSLYGGVLRALRLFDLFTLLWVMGRWTQPDDVLALVGRRFSRMGLTLAMVMNFFPQFIAERSRIDELFRLRFAGGINRLTLVSRIHAEAMIYRVLLMNALERSWQLAESMYVRGYGSTRRSRYHTISWRWKDTSALFVLVLACTATVGFCSFAAIIVVVYVGFVLGGQAHVRA